jgi:hypothetical protein
MAAAACTGLLSEPEEWYQRCAYKTDRTDAAANGPIIWLAFYSREAADITKRHLIQECVDKVCHPTDIVVLDLELQEYSDEAKSFLGEKITECLPDLDSPRP